MGVRFIGDPDADLRRFIKQKEDRLYAALAAAMIGIVHDAEWDAKARTAASGRIDTGAMFNAIGSTIQFKAKSIIGEVGFTQDMQDYYLYQTVTGFQHWLSGQRIEPTGAIAEAAVEAQKNAQEAIEQAIRSVA